MHFSTIGTNRWEVISDDGQFAAAIRRRDLSDGRYGYAVNDISPHRASPRLLDDGHQLPSLERAKGFVLGYALAQEHHQETTS
ncbi:hypothetical protein [Streptacidiphilus cavernicola]|uniref:Uncharacterized protein n=1 Tax=Streptacidiphilus cavernicola TaxID=3342716 RepID=A0ABV6VYU6_9ACTN